MEDSPQKKMK